MGRKNRKTANYGMEYESDEESNVSNVSKFSHATKSSKVSQLSGFLEENQESIDPDDIDAQISHSLELVDSNKQAVVLSGLKQIVFCLSADYHPICVLNSWESISLACTRILRAKKSDQLCQFACIILSLLCFYIEPESAESERYCDDLIRVIPDFIREAQQHHTKKLKNKFDVSAALGCRAIAFVTRLLLTDEKAIAESIDILWTISISAAKRSAAHKCVSALSGLAIICSDLRPKKSKALLRRENFLKNSVLLLQDENTTVRESIGALLCILFGSARKTFETGDGEYIHIYDVLGHNEAESETKTIMDLVLSNSNCSEKELNSDDRKCLKEKFRRILYWLESDDYDPMPVINCGLRGFPETVEFTSWSDDVMYEGVKSIFGGYVLLQFRRNLAIREIFSLGEPREFDEDDDEDKLATRGQKERIRVQQDARQKDRQQRKKAGAFQKSFEQQSYDY